MRMRDDPQGPQVGGPPIQAACSSSTYRPGPRNLAGASFSPHLLPFLWNLISFPSVSLIFFLAALRTLLHALMHLLEMLNSELTCGSWPLGSFENLELGPRSSGLKSWLGLL